MVLRLAVSILRPPARAGAGFCLSAASDPRTTVKGIFYLLKIYRGTLKPFQSSKDKDSISSKTNGRTSSKTGAKKPKKPSENPMSKEYYTTDAHSNEILKTNLMPPSAKHNYTKNESFPNATSTTLQQKNRKYL